MRPFRRARPAASLLPLLVLAVALGALPPAAPAAARTVAGELWVQSGCPYCASAVAGFQDLSALHGPTEFVGLTFTYSPPWSLPEGASRAADYGVTGTPYAVFDGTQHHVGGEASGSMLSSYAPHVDDRLAVPSPLTMTAGYTILDGQVNVSTHITVDAATTGTGRVVRVFAAQDGLLGYVNLVVAMPPAQPFTLTTPGEQVIADCSFAFDAGWSEDDLAVVVLVQDTTTGEVLQATRAVPQYAGRVVVDCEPDGAGAGWTLSGPSLERAGDGDAAFAVFATGPYAIAWEDLPVWTEPTGPTAGVLAAGDTLIFVGAYTDAPFAGVSGAALDGATAGGGVALVDVDRDGRLDLHLAGPAGAGRLLRGDGAGGFVATDAAFLSAPGEVRAAAWADVNGDGWPDVYLTRADATNLLYLGDGLGGFTPATVVGDDEAADSGAVAWIDYDRDGLLDVPVANLGGANTLLRNYGELAPGLVALSPQSCAFEVTADTRAIAWGDGDLDGRLDPFLADAWGANVLLQNSALGFADVTGGAGLGDPANGTGAAWGDYDNDGDLDLYVTNDGQEDLLYRCTGPFEYTRVFGAEVHDSGHGRGVVWADLDNDGNLDLYVVRHDEPDLALLGDGAGGFVRLPVGLPEADAGGNAVACGDVDGDGQLDLAVSRSGAPDAVLLNTFPAGNHWFGLRLTGSGANTGAVGARVVVTAGGMQRTRLTAPASGYLDGAAAAPHFGLGAADLVERIEIFWPSGRHQVIGGQAADQVLDVTEGVPIPSGVAGDDLPGAPRLGRASPNPFNPLTSIGFVLDRADRAELAVYALDGRLVRVLADAEFGPGPHRVAWDGTDAAGRPAASGAYLYRLRTARGFTATGRMTLVK